MSQWDSVDRMRGELRAWLRDKQEEVEDIEQQPSKLHAEAAELDIAKLQVLGAFRGAWFYCLGRIQSFQNHKDVEFNVFQKTFCIFSILKLNSHIF